MNKEHNHEELETLFIIYHMRQCTTKNIRQNIKEKDVKTHVALHLFKGKASNDNESQTNSPTTKKNFNTQVVPKNAATVNFKCEFSVSADLA